MFASAPEVVAHVLTIANRVEAVLDDKNRAAIAETLANIRDTTGTIAHRDKDIDSLITDAGLTMHNLAATSVMLNVLVANLEHASGKADRLIESANTTFDTDNQAGDDDLDAVVQSSRPGLQRLTTTDMARLDQLLIEANQLTSSLNRLSDGLEHNPRQVLFGTPATDTGRHDQHDDIPTPPSSSLRPVSCRWQVAACCRIRRATDVPAESRRPRSGGCALAAREPGDRHADGSQKISTQTVSR